MNLKKAFILCLSEDKKSSICKNTWSGLVESDLMCPMEPYFGLHGAKEPIPDKFTGGRWNTDLVNMNGSKAVCYSHLSLILGAIGICESDNDVILVAEHDVALHKDAMKSINSIELPNDWDFIHLAYWDPKCGTAHQLKVNDHLAKLVNPACTGMYCYLVRPRKVFQRLIDCLPLECEIDNFLASKALDGTFNTYIIEHQPWLAQEISEVSKRGSIDDASWSSAQQTQ